MNTVCARKGKLTAKRNQESYLSGSAPNCEFRQQLEREKVLPENRQHLVSQRTRRRDQNSMRAENWADLRLRDPLLVACPKLALPTAVLATPKKVWLVRLYNSARKSSLVASVMCSGKLRIMAISAW